MLSELNLKTANFKINSLAKLEFQGGKLSVVSGKRFLVSHFLEDHHLECPIPCFSACMLISLSELPPFCSIIYRSLF